jgi:FKBP-type peptidyl-prolyl cis-trans isomerase SlyD
LIKKDRYIPVFLISKKGMCNLNSNNQPNSVENNKVVRLDYTLTVEGQVVDTSEESEPIEFIQGKGQIIPGLEKELYGMDEGDSKEITIPASDAYGDVDETAVMDVPREQFPPEVPLQEGVQIQVRSVEGQVLDARISSVGDETIELDFNHPLAGKELNFQVTVVEVRDATADEISHGHVHNDSQHPEDIE